MRWQQGLSLVLRSCSLERRPITRPIATGSRSRSADRSSTRQRWFPLAPSSSLHPSLASLTNSDSLIDLEQAFPPLEKYCPHLPSKHQALFLLLDCREAGYGGAAGGGKSDALLMGALQYVDRPEYASLLLRRTYAELSKADSLIPRSHEWLAATDARWSEDLKTWKFPSGATLEFGHVEHKNDKYKYQSAAYQYIGFDELTSFSEATYDYIGFSRARRKLDSLIPIRTRWASNPGGVGHGWVKQRYIDDRKRGVVFIPAKVADNPGLDVEAYRASLHQLPEVLREQLLEGDWGAFEGAAFTITADHLVKPFKLTHWWERFESMDYGLDDRTAWIFWTIDGDGNVIAFLTFQSKKEHGLPSETAPVILTLRASTRSRTCWGDPQSLAMPTSTVNRLGMPTTIHTEFADHGLWLARANNNPRAGYTRLCEFLRCDSAHSFPDWHPRWGEQGAPRIFLVARTCPQLLKQLREAILQPLELRHGGEMVDPRWESAHGHFTAAARYGIMSRFPSSEEPERVPEDPRAALLYRYERRQENLANEKQSYQWA